MIPAKSIAGMTAYLFAIVLASALPQKEACAVTTDYEEAPSRFDEIVVSPTRAPKKVSDTSMNITVISEEDLKSLPAADPAEALTYVPGVDVIQRTRFGHFVPLAIQGSQSRHVLVMVDGIPFNTQASGQADILPALPLGNIRRIEVVRGSATSAWGSSLGGLINIVTKDPAQSQVPKGSVSAAFAEFKTQRESFEVSGLIQKLGYYFSGEYRQSGGARTKGGTENREDTLQKKFFGKWTFPFSDIVKMMASFGYSGAKINEGVYPSSLTRTEVPYYARYGQARVDFDPEEKRHFEAAVKFNRQLIHFETLDGITNDSFGLVKTEDNYYGSELKGVFGFREKDTLVIGYDLSFTVLKTTLMDDSRDILSHAPYANYTLVLPPFDLIGGLRYDVNGEYGDQLNPSFGVVYHVGGVPRTVLRFNVTRSYNPPPLLWPYFEDVFPGFTANNPDIRPERSMDYEAGIESEAVENLWLKFSVYRSDVRDGIITDVNDEGFFIKKNVERFRQQGFQFESNLKVTKETSLYFAAGYNDVEDRMTHEKVRNRGVTKPNYRLGLKVETPWGFLFHILGRYDRWDSSPDLDPNDRTFIFDGRLSQKIPLVRGVDGTFFFNAYNLTNSKYWMDSDFPLPERYFEGGVTIEF